MQALEGAQGASGLTAWLAVWIVLCGPSASSRIYAPSSVPLLRLSCGRPLASSPLCRKFLDASPAAFSALEGDSSESPGVDNASGKPLHERSLCPSSCALLSPLALGSVYPHKQGWSQQFLVPCSHTHPWSPLLPSPLLLSSNGTDRALYGLPCIAPSRGLLQDQGALPRPLQDRLGNDGH